MLKRTFTQIGAPDIRALEDNSRYCGARHPLNPQITCVRQGKCKNGSHLGILDVNGVQIYKGWRVDASIFSHPGIDD